MIKLAALFFALLAAPAWAANHYVRSGASGTGGGSDWTNACTDFSGSCAVGSLIRGDTYYVATGTYAGRTFSTASSGTSVITIKGATVADHGTATGWIASYSVSSTDGGTQASWSNEVDFTSSYWTFDGNTNTPVWSTTTTDYGFKFVNGLDTVSTIGVPGTVSVNGAPLTNITISHVTALATTSDVQKEVVMGASSGGAHSNCTISHSLFNGWQGLVMTKGQSGTAYSNWEISYNVLLNGYSSSANHGEWINPNERPIDGWKIAFNLFKGHSGSSGMTGTIVANNSDNNNAKIYGNVFDGLQVGNGVITGTSAGDLNNAVVYNNTFLNMTSDSGNAIGGTGQGTGNAALNNVFYNMDASYGGGFTHDYSSFYSATGIPSEAHGQTAAGNPFINSTAGNYQLTSDTSVWSTLGSPYNIDPVGTTRTSSRGALQISGGGPTAPTITSTSPLPAGTASSAYSQTLAASGTPPITWGITSGVLPAGLSLGSSSGTISGTATTPGTSTITVQATNSVGNVSKTLLLTVNAAPPVINSFSASPASINAGTSSTLSWATTGATVVAIDNGIGTVTGTSKSVTPTSTTIYKLTATNAGGSVSAMATVTVTIGGGLGTPPAIAGFTDADLLVAADHCDTTLSADITDTTLSLSVASLSTCVPNQVLFIDSEQLKNCSGASNVFTICSGGRGFAGTAAATHKQGARVRGRIGAVYHNQAVQADIALANLIAGQTHHGTYPGGTSIGGACWPNHICSIAELYTASDFADSTLSAGIGATDTSLTVADGSFYQASQVVQVGQEFIKVGTASGTTLSGLTRGIGGTAAAQHATGSSIVGVIAAFEFERLKLELHAMESDLYGTAGSTQSSVCGTSCPVVTGVSWPNHVFDATEAGTAVNGGPFPALWQNRLKDEIKAFKADLTAHP